MRRRFIPSWLLSAGMTLGFFPLAYAQTVITMPHNSGATTYTLAPPTNCSVTFTDFGGPDGDYPNQSGAGSVITFFPSAAGNKIVVQFTSFHVETAFDGLFVYDGPTTASPQISSGTPALIGLPNSFSSGMGAWQGTVAPYNVAPGTVRAGAANASGAITFAFDSDLTIGKNGWTAVVAEVPGNVCTLLAPGTMNTAVSAGECTASVQTTPPAISPPACALAMELQYRVNGGPAVALPMPPPPTVNISGLPVGLNVVSWQLVSPCGAGLAASVAQLVNVLDNAPPTLAVPPNVTLNLGPGECRAVYNYSVSAFDNCTFTPAAGRVDHPLDFNNGAAGLMFDLKNLSGEPLLITEFGPVLDPGTWPLEVYVSAAPGSWQGIESTPSAWALTDQRSVVSAGPEGPTALTGFSLLLAPGETRGVYITSTLGAPLRYTGTGGGTQRQFDDGALRVSAAPGAAKAYPFGQTYTARAYNGYVKYATARLQPEQIGGLPTDSEFPVGVTTNVFRCVDQVGNSTTASFTVTVKAYANTANTLLCAGTVNASLGKDCETTLQAGDILLGGPYRCFDSYNVQIDKIPPYTDGPWLPAVLKSGDIGKTYGVRVSDPVNNNVCFSSVLIEDKLPPSMTADVLDLPCNFNTAPTYSAPVSVLREFTPTETLPASVGDFQTLLLNIPAPVPADAVVEDLDLYLRVNGDVYEKNLTVELQSPSGAIVKLWKQAAGCTGPLWVRFDDESDANTDCARFNSNQRARIPFGAASLSAFDNGPASGVWKLRLRDEDGFADLAVATEVKLILRYKAAFSAGFPNGLVFPGQITQVSQNSFSVPAPLLDGCSTVALSFSDETITKPCSTGLTAVINRTWTARDAANNATTALQTIRLIRPNLDDVVLPPNYNDSDAPSFECAGPYPTPGWIEGQGKQGFPYVYGRPAGCSVNWSYSDAVIPVCRGSYTINRTWSIFDACTAQTRQAMQLIQMTDRQAPTLPCPANLTVSTDLYTCCALADLPDVVADDACSAIGSAFAKVIVFNQYSGDTAQVLNMPGALQTFPGNNLADPDTMAVFGSAGCLPVGTHHVYYRAEDDCGNQNSCSFKITVADYTPPVAVGQSLSIVSLNADDLNDCYLSNPAAGAYAGVTLVPASVFDQGSYDNCNFIRLTVRRMPPYSPCIQALNTVNGAPPCSDNFPDLKSEYTRAIGESDTLKFYCCEAGTTQTIALRCYQLDAFGNYSMGPNGQPLFNETLVQVAVQDKLKPGCQPPADITVSCENFDPDLPKNYGLPSLVDNCCLDTSKTYHGQPGLTHATDYALFDTVCNRGTLVRTFKVFDCQGQNTQCTQRVVVTHDPDFAIRFPDDVLITACDSTGIYGKPEFFGQGCASLAVSFHDEVSSVVPDACYVIERTWKVINWCDHVPGAGCVEVPNPTPNATLNHPSNLPGVIVSPPGTPSPWTATVVKVKPADAQPTNYSSFWSPGVNCYEYTQIIKILDSQPPKMQDCPSGTQPVDDATTNAADLWNEIYWYDPGIDAHNLADGPSDLSISATDLCSNGNASARYLLFLNLDADGAMETVVSSADLPPANTVMYGNAVNPNFTGGTARAFDERPVPTNQKYRFAVQVINTPKKVTAALRWNTEADPDTYVLPQLPYGTHKLKWFVADGCGNEQACEYFFKVADTKAPTVVCLSGLSVNIMPTKMIELWATDFLQYAEDNFTPSNKLKLGIRKAGPPGTGFPFLGDGVTPQTSVIFTCDELGPQEVELWAMDVAGNMDFCKTFVIVQDNAGNCLIGPSVVAGTLKTETNQGLDAAQVTIAGTHPSLPPINVVSTTDLNGNFSSFAVPPGSDITVTPLKDNDPLNGVSTFDLVLINKHVLGLEPLGTPYKMIAADANGSRSITTFDIVELRKLILGIYTDFPANTSWRFIDKSYTFPDPLNPFQEIFPEAIHYPNFQGNSPSADFVAIKTGDVNGNAMTSASATPEDRGSGTDLLFDVAAPAGFDLRAGQAFDVRFKAATPVSGYQFTLSFPDLELLNIDPGPGMDAGHFAHFPAQHALTTSFHTAALHNTDTAAFTLHFRAKGAGDLSRMLAVSSRITRAESYWPELRGVALRFLRPGGPIVTGQDFEVYQNVPNPWQHHTRIGFYLPRAGEVSLRVSDELGRTLLTRRGAFGKGFNHFYLEDGALPALPGVLFYEVESGGERAVRRMVKE